MEHPETIDVKRANYHKLIFRIYDFGFWMAIWNLSSFKIRNRQSAIRNVIIPNISSYLPVTILLHSANLITRHLTDGRGKGAPPHQESVLRGLRLEIQGFS